MLESILLVHALTLRLQTANNITKWNQVQEELKDGTTPHASAPAPVPVVVVCQIFHAHCINKTCSTGPTAICHGDRAVEIEVVNTCSHRGRVRILGHIRENLSAMRAAIQDPRSTQKA